MTEKMFANALFWSFRYLNLEFVCYLVLPPSPLKASADRWDLVLSPSPSRATTVGVGFRASIFEFSEESGFGIQESVN